MPALARYRLHRIHAAGWKGELAVIAAPPEFRGGRNYQSGIGNCCSHGGVLHIRFDYSSSGSIQRPATPRLDIPLEFSRRRSVPAARYAEGVAATTAGL